MHVRRDRLVVVRWREQPVHAVRQHRGHAADVGGDHRQSAGERFEHRQRHVVDRRRLHVDVRIGVDSGESRTAARARQRSRYEARVQRRAREERRPASPTPTRVSVASGWRACIRANARSDRRDVVERLEVPRREQARPQRVAHPIGESLQIDGVGDDLRRDAERRQHVAQERRTGRRSRSTQARITRRASADRRR